MYYWRAVVVTHHSMLFNGQILLVVAIVPVSVAMSTVAVSVSISTMNVMLTVGVSVARLGRPPVVMAVSVVSVMIAMVIAAVVAVAVLVSIVIVPVVKMCLKYFSGTLGIFFPNQFISNQRSDQLY